MIGYQISRTGYVWRITKYITISSGYADVVIAENAVIDYMEEIQLCIKM